jgi:branched-chain amino acid transport system permease protein
MELASNIVIYGLSYGFILFLAAVGLSIALGLLDIVNVTHGVLFMLGGYVGITVLDTTGSWMLGLAAAAVTSGVVSLIISEAFLRHLHKQQLQQILLCFGLVYVISNLVLWIWGAYPRVADVPAAISTNLAVGEISIPVYRLVVIAVGIAVFVMFWLLQERTKIGAIIRAGMDDPEMLSGLGYNLRPIAVAAFCIGIAFAGLAAFLGSGVLGGVSTWMGPRIFFLNLVVVIVGGVVYIQCTLAGALLVGLLYVTVAIFYPPFAIVSTYIAMIVVLLLRPSGLLGRKL